MESKASDWVSETAFGKWFLGTDTWLRYVLAHAVADLDALAGATLPRPPVVVKMPDIWKRVREMGKDRTERIADTAPKALRQEMREMAREG